MEIFEKPWGKEELLEHNPNYMVKRLTMLKGHRCSLQKHNQKTETIYVLSGVLKIQHGKFPDALEEKNYMPGDSVTLRAGVVHRMEGVENSVYLEASTPELDDVVRFSDDYKRG